MALHKTYKQPSYLFEFFNVDFPIPDLCVIFGYKVTDLVAGDSEPTEF